MMNLLKGLSSLTSQDLIVTRIFLVLFIFLSIQSKAQSNIITGQIMDDSSQPVIYVNIQAISAPDSAVIGGAVSDENGRFKLEVKHGFSGWLRLSAIGYSDKFVDLETEQKFYRIKLNTGTRVVDEVVISGEKMLYELEPDRMVVNISSVPSLSGNNALQLLQKTPGVIVNRQTQSINMTAKGEVMIMINNKIQRIPMEVLMARLQGMQAENIDRIEVIHQPGARYDASGSAGIIHIVLKENNAYGTNGNISVMAGYGQREKAGFNSSINYRKNNLNLYADYSFNWDRNDEFDTDHFREYSYMGDDYYYENYVDYNNRRVGQNAVNLGADINVNPTLTIGALFGFSKSFDLIDAPSASLNYVNEALEDELEMFVTMDNHITSITGNLNMLKKLNDQSSINFDAYHSNIHYENFSKINSYTEDQPANITADRFTKLAIWIGKLDYFNQINSSTKLEAGVKGTFTDISSIGDVTDQANEDWIGNTRFTGEDQLNEKILAGYTSLYKDVTSRLSVEAGLRYEYYNYLLDSFLEEADADQTYNNLFPIFRLNYDIDSTTRVQLGFNRTVTRPDFTSLAFYFAFLDPSVIALSNPQLKPSFTNTLRLSIQHKSWIISASYLNQKNTLYWFNTVIKEEGLQVSTPKNMDQSNVVEFNVLFPINFSDWWETNWSLQLLYQSVRDSSTHILPFEDDIVTFSIQLNNTFHLGKGWTINFDGRYMSPFLVGDQVQYSYPYVNAGVRKAFNPRSALSISFMDIANTIGELDWEYDQPELSTRTYGYLQLSERQVRVTYTYTFGNNQIKRRERNSQDQAMEGRF